MLEGIKAERIDKHRRLVLKEVYNDFVASQPLHAIVPGLVDVGLIPQFAAVINSPLEEDITANHFNSALEKLPTFTADWRASKDAMLVDLMKIHIPGFQIGDLSLPTTIFKCTNCRTPTPIQYPRVLSHLHLMCDRRLEGGKIFEDPRRGWSPQLLRFDSSLYESARTIIQTCRLDAATITATQGLPAPAAFFNCTSPDCAGYFMTWSGAVCSALPCKYDSLIGITSGEAPRIGGFGSDPLWPSSRYTSGIQYRTNEYCNTPAYSRERGALEGHQQCMLEVRQVQAHVLLGDVR